MEPGTNVMLSGIFWIGQEGLSADNFEEFVKSVIREHSYSVDGVSELNDEKGCLLVALSRQEGDLIKGLETVLKKAGEKAKEHNEKLPEFSSDDDYAPLPYFINSCSILEIYPDLSGAKDSFKTTVLDYRSRRIQKAYERLEQTEEKLRTSLSRLEERFRELANTSLGKL